MIGVNNDVKLKEEMPNLVVIRCIYFSFQLAVSAATELMLPRNLELSKRNL